MAKKEFDETGTKAEKALYLAEELHCKIFPLNPNSKKPAIDDWPHNASDNPKVIKKFFTEHPDYNIGILTGGGLCCIDLDTKNENENGPDTLHDWEMENGPLPDTLRVRTPTGCIHLYYHTNEDYGSVNHKHDGTTFFEDIDVHNDTGHYMVGPGSVIDGQAYMFEAGSFPDEIDLADEDDTLRKFINDALSKPQAAETSTKSDSNSSERREKITVPKEIKAGERHNQIVSLALSLRAQDIPKAAILDTISIVNDERCEEPKWKEKDLEKLVEWVMTKDTSQAQTEAQKIKRDEAQTEAQAENAHALAGALVSLASVEEHEAEWLIPGIIPKGQITLLVSDGGVGKTWLWCDMAAKLSAGKKCILDDPDIPFKVREPAKVMFFSSEDSVSTVLKPRLAMAGADFNNITTIPLENELFEQVKIGNPAFESLLAEIRPELCVFDPLQSFISDRVKMAERNAMRQALTPLIGYGEEYGTTFLIICHSNKRAGAYGRLRVADSADIWDIARCVLLAGETGQDGVKYVSQEKNNYGPCVNTILFSIKADESKGQILKFEGTTKKKDYDYVTEKDRTRRSAPEREEAKTAIENILAFSGGHILSSDLEKQVIEYGIKRSTYNRARKELASDGVIETHKIGMKNFYTAVPGWYESLSPDDLAELARDPQGTAADEVKNIPENKNGKI